MVSSVDRAGRDGPVDQPRHAPRRVAGELTRGVKVDDRRQESEALGDRRQDVRGALGAFEKVEADQQTARAKEALNTRQKRLRVEEGVAAIVGAQRLA